MGWPLSRFKGGLESTEITTEDNEEVIPELSNGSSIYSETTDLTELAVSQVSNLPPTEPPTTLQGSGSSSSPERSSEPRQAWKCTKSKTQQDKGKRTHKAQPASEESNQKQDRVKIRKLLDSKLSNYKQNNLKKRLPASESAAEELHLRQKMVKQMEESDKAFEKNLSRLSGNLEKLTGAITVGFGLLEKMLSPTEQSTQSRGMYYSQLQSAPDPYHHMPGSIYHTRAMPSDPWREQRINPPQPISCTEETSRPITPEVEFNGDEYTF